MTTTPIQISKGAPLPFGATKQSNGVNFALAAKDATSVKLLIYDLDKNHLFAEFPLDSRENKTGDVWHILVEINPNQSWGYAYQVEIQKKDPNFQYLNGIKTVLDPYAKSVHSETAWGKLSCGNKEAYCPCGLYLPNEEFDWENDKPLEILKKDLIIYEMHVRGFTQHASSHVKNPGTFLGVIEKIPHLVDLGINAVELLPVQEFNECEYKINNPHIHETLYQFWGYSTVNFFSPMNRFAANQMPGASIHEFKTMVKALHKNGIAVILDVVFNHTNEGNEKGPINSFKGIDPNTYYMMGADGHFMNFTGCGNTVNTNQPLVQKLIIDTLRYWVLEMHVDGFRFDLASIFNRGIDGDVIHISSIVEAISKDPILSKTILIAEPWDAAGLYQVGNFHPHDQRWSEWNAQYRDTIRRFIKGAPSVKGKFASRLSGSEDIYGSRSPLSSINFIVAHDGFTLHDLVSYNQKHNLANGENNHDGENNNESWNCGKEGETPDPKINELRQRQMRNLHLALMISQGIPMILMGDEYGHTKKGNNNTWCHDTPLNWFIWDKLKDHSDFYRFYRKLIEFRKKHPCLNKGSFLTDQDINWHNKNGHKISWDKEPQFLAFTLSDHEKKQDLYCAFNAQNIPLDVEMPNPKENQKWHLIVNTGNLPPNDFFDPPIPFENTTFHMAPFSAVLFKCMN